MTVLEFEESLFNSMLESARKRGKSDYDLGYQAGFTSALEETNKVLLKLQVKYPNIWEDINGM